MVDGSTSHPKLWEELQVPPLPQGLNHLPFIPPALLSGHLAEAPVPAILYCAAGEKNETAQVCLPALERL